MNVCYVGAGNAETVSLLLEVGRGQDINTPCFSGNTALDYVNKTLAWLETGDTSAEELPFFSDFNVVFTSVDYEKKKQKYMRCQAVLKKHGALERTNAFISVEQGCRDMTFSSAKGGTYAIASATPYAALLRLTSFLFYSKKDAELLLLTYKAYITPSELLRLCKIRFYQLNNLPEKSLALCDEQSFQLGVSFDEAEHVTLQLLALEDTSEDQNNGDRATVSTTSSSEKELAEGMEQQSLGRKNSSRDSKNYIKGVDTSVQQSSDNESSFIVQNSCIGKIFSGCDNLSILKKLLACLSRCFDGVEMVSHSLILRDSGRFFILENLSMSRVYKDSTSWSCRLVSPSSESGFRIPGVSVAQAPCKITSLSLRCMPAHKMMRGKAVFELQVSFLDNIAQSIQVEAAVLAAHKEELSLLCAKVLFGFACDAFSPDIPLLRAPRLLTSKSTIDMFEEASPSASQGEMEALQSCQRQIAVLEKEFNQHKENEG